MSPDPQADSERHQRVSSQTRLRLGFSVGRCLESFLQQGAHIDRGLRERLEHDTALRPRAILALLSERNTLQPKQVWRAFADGLGLPFLDMDWISPDASLLKLLPIETWKRFRAFPMSQIGTALEVATADPFDLELTMLLEQQHGLQATRMLALPQQVEAYLATAAVSAADVQQLLTTLSEGELERITQELSRGELSGVVPFAEHLLVLARKLHASDIHIEPLEQEVRVRLRIDGELQETLAMKPRVGSALVGYFKVAASLDIAERRLPQDGRISSVVGGTLDLRVSTVPTSQGEKVCIRLLDRQLQLLDLNSLMMSELVHQGFERCLDHPHGLILICGPTGSGKTTTLYAALHRLSKPQVNITTIEDPVEYQLGGVNQIQVNSKIDLGFARALRAVLRQDPDIILIGEIRDSETAKIAVQAALTGHLVLSTVHTNSALEAFHRLVELGADREGLAQALRGILAQRLVPRPCLHCASRIPARDPRLAPLGLHQDPHPPPLWESPGCEQCRYTGIQGRIAVQALVLLDDGLRNVLSQGAQLDVLERHAREHGYRPLAHDALVKCLLGLVRIEDVVQLARTHQELRP